MKVQLLSNESYKKFIFKGVTFPITVNAVQLTKGALKGYYSILGSQLKLHGCDVWDELLDSTFEFSPNVIVPIN